MDTPPARTLGKPQEVIFSIVFTLSLGCICFLMQGKSDWVEKGGPFPCSQKLHNNFLVRCEASASVFLIASPGVGIDFSAVARAT